MGLCTSNCKVLTLNYKPVISFLHIQQHVKVVRRFSIKKCPIPKMYQLHSISSLNDKQRDEKTKSVSKFF